MKTRLFLGFLFLMLLLPSIAFASSDGIDRGFLMYNEDENTYEMFGEEPSKSNFSASSTSTTNADSVIFNVNVNMYVDIVEVKYKRMNSNNSSYSYQGFYPKREVLKTATGSKVTLSGFNFSETDTYYVTLSGKAALINYQITADDIGKSIDLSTDNTFVSVAADLSDIASGVQIEHIGLTQVDENNVTINTGIVGNGALVPAGTYNVQIGAVDNSRGYYLLKKNVKVSNTDPTIEIFRSEVAEVPVTNYATIQKLTGFHISTPDVGINHYRIGNLRKINNITSVFINKASIVNITFSFEAGSYVDGTDYNLTLQKEIDTTVPQSLKLDMNLQAKINLVRTSFKPNEYISGGRYSEHKMGIYDSFGNQVNGIWGSKTNATGTITLENTTNPTDIYTFPNINLSAAYAQLPAVNGIYKMTLSINNAPFEIPSASTIIAIGDATIPPEPTPTGPDLNNDGIVDIFDIVKAAKQSLPNLKEVVNNYSNYIY